MSLSHEITDCLLTELNRLIPWSRIRDNSCVSRGSLQCDLCRAALDMWKLGLYALICLHITVRLLMYWSVNLAAKLTFKAEPRLTEASDVLVVPSDFSGHAEIIPLQKRHLVLTSPPCVLELLAKSFCTARCAYIHMRDGDIGIAITTCLFPPMH